MRWVYFLLGVVVGAAVVGMTGPAAPASLAPNNTTLGNTSINVSVPALHGSASTPTSAGGPATPTDTPESSLDTAALEVAIHAEINERRVAHGLSELTHESGLREIARGHSQNMATTGFFDHTAPDGDTFEDRYAQAGYDCRVPTGDGQYLIGAENIAYRTSLESDEHAIAEAIVEGWMDSPGHRENILRPAWENEGIGVAVATDGDETTVYATQNFC